MNDFILMLIIFIVLFVTGVLLIKTYKPTPDKQNPNIVWTSLLSEFLYGIGFILFLLSLILFFASFGYLPK